MDDLSPSEIGTREHWKTCYQQEFENFLNNGDIGDVWFGEQSVVNIVQWILSSKEVARFEPILDIGCGNGLLLVELAKEGFTNLFGIDYVEEAILLARGVAVQEGVKISYQVGDILEDKSCSHLQQQYKVVLDKGTYDTISLSPQNAIAKRQKYIKLLYQLIDADGYVVLATCNWTKEEILSHFKEFKLHHHIPSQSFQFGGKVGAAVTYLVLTKI